eukprot:m.354729 g.354729  ORF g.354729 m.354729 type:complete len:82 (-) comp17089_c0_seq1:437-682(-)
MSKCKEHKRHDTNLVNETPSGVPHAQPQEELTDSPDKQPSCIHTTHSFLLLHVSHRRVRQKFQTNSQTPHHNCRFLTSHSH